MPATPRTIDVTPADLTRPVHVSEGLTPAELAAAFDRIYWGAEVMEIPEPAYLLDDWVPRGALVFLTGHGNSGKSLLALAWAQCIARGHPWSGHAVVTPGRVLYLTQEGVTSFKHRILALHAQRGYDEWAPLFGLLPKSLELGAKTDRDGHVDQGQSWAELEELIREHRPVMVVIDPWADYFRPGQENSNDDAKAWVTHARMVLASLGEDAPALVVPSHTARSNERGGEVRGASAIYDGADRVYTITPLFPDVDKSGGFTAKGDLLGMMVSTLKSKDGGRPGPWYGKVYEHTVEGALGGTSVAVDGISQDAFRDLEEEAKGLYRAQQASQTDAQRRQAVKEHVRRSPGQTWTVIRKEIGGSMEALAEVRDELLESGELKKIGTMYFLKDQEAPDEL